MLEYQLKLYTTFVFCLLMLDYPNRAVSPPTHKHHRFRVEASTFSIHTAPVHTQKKWLWTHFFSFIPGNPLGTHATSVPPNEQQVTLHYNPYRILQLFGYLYSTLFNNHSFKVHWWTNPVQPSKRAIQFRFILFNSPLFYAGLSPQSPLASKNNFLYKNNNNKNQRTQLACHGIISSPFCLRT